MAGTVGFEPTTDALTVRSSAVELDASNGCHYTRTLGETADSPDR